MGSYRCIYVRKRKFLTSVLYQRTEGVYQIDVILLVKSQHLAQCLTALCSQFSCQIGRSSAELSLNTTFNAKHFTESVPTHCFNFKGISLSPEFGLHAHADYSTEIHGHK